MANYPEYLERNALIERIEKAYCDGCENYNGVRCSACGIGDAIEVVEDAPTALERTAEWIAQDDTFTRFECSRCHTKNHHTRWNYRPNCGSLMENKEDGQHLLASSKRTATRANAAFVACDQNNVA